MSIDWNAELVDQLESHWQHQLRPRLDGLTDDEYLWQPVPGCWTISPRAESSARDRDPVTTIAWKLAHLIDVFGPPTASRFAGGPADHPASNDSGTASGALRQLDERHDAWVSDVRGLGAAGLARPQGALSPPEYADAPMARLVLYIHLEVIHHGAEICLLRDLYLWKDGGAA